MFFVKNQALAAAILGLLLTASCRKNVADETSPASDSTTVNSPANLIKDTALQVSRGLYLWHAQIPADFNARSYAGPDAIMSAIRRYSKEPGFADPVDRWSFAMKQDTWNNISSGITKDFGLGVFFRDETDLRVKHVEAASPAGKAGITRGWRITKINGNGAINTNNVDFVAENVFESKATTFTFEKPDGTTADVTLNAATYQENPIVLDTVYQVGNKKIGYFAFNSFLGDTTQIYTAFENIFEDFAARQVSDVIVDLRYNGGGYVDVQERLANYLAPAAANGDVMMKQEYNDRLQEFNSTDRFSKRGALNLSRIFFIVSKSTASASELLINNLKPYMNVQVVGPDKTYGKPVGFFPYPAGAWYVFPVSFRSVNKNGEGSYFGGLELSKQVADGLDKNWGDLQEASLASIVAYITNGGYPAQPTRSTRALKNPAIVTGNRTLDQPAFKGAVDASGIR